MTKKYYTVCKKGISYYYLAAAYRPHKVKYFHSKRKEGKSLKMIESLERAKVKQFCWKEYHVR